jgi:hypothetical protein
MAEFNTLVNQKLSDSNVGWSYFGEYHKYTNRDGDTYVDTAQAADTWVQVMSDSTKRVIFVTPEYRRYATAYVYLLSGLKIKGVDNPDAVSWDLPEQGRTLTVRAAKCDNLEHLDALWFATVPKDGSEGALIGVNFKDKRIEFPRVPETPPGTIHGPPSGGDTPSNPPGGHTPKGSNKKWYPGSGTVPKGDTNNPDNPVLTKPINNVGNQPGESSGGTVKPDTPVDQGTDTRAPGTRQEHPDAADGGQGTTPIAGDPGSP